MEWQSNGYRSGLRFVSHHSRSSHVSLSWRSVYEMHDATCYVPRKRIPGSSVDQVED